MFPRSLILLASAGAAVAQMAPECEHVTDVTALLQADDGKVYCSSVLGVGTTTSTVVESSTTTETTTITTPTQLTLSLTATQTDTVSEGTVTATAATATETLTIVEPTTVYSCSTAFKRRDYGEAQSTSCTKSKTTSTPTPTSTSCTKGKTSVTPTPTPVEASTSCTKSKQHATSAAVYGAGQPPVSSQSAVSSAQEGYHAHGPSQAAYPSPPANGGYSASPNSEPTPQASTASALDSSSSVYYDSYPEQSSAAYNVYPESTVEAYPVTSSVYEQIVSSSMYYSSEIITSSEISSEIYTPSPTPTPTPTPTPVPSCEAAPTALQTGYACDTISTACGCLGLTSATAAVPTTTTLTETISVTEAAVFTTSTQLTETVFTTVPAATETVTPSVTVTTTATATATVCPCSSSQSLCGSTPDTCKDLQNDANNCGACGNVCGSGLCLAGKCANCVPRSCGTFNKGSCSSAGVCYCVTGSEGQSVCSDIGRGSCTMYTRCDVDANCATDEICTKSTCCTGQGICVKKNVCGNTQNAKRMFAPRGNGAMGNEVLGKF